MRCGAAAVRDGCRKGGGSETRVVCSWHVEASVACANLQQSSFGNCVAWECVDVLADARCMHRVGAVGACTRGVRGRGMRNTPGRGAVCLWLYEAQLVHPSCKLCLQWSVCGVAKIEYPCTQGVQLAERLGAGTGQSTAWLHECMGRVRVIGSYLWKSLHLQGDCPRTELGVLE